MNECLRSKKSSESASWPFEAEDENVLMGFAGFDIWLAFQPFRMGFLSISTAYSVFSQVVSRICEDEAKLYVNF